MKTSHFVILLAFPCLMIIAGMFLAFLLLNAPKSEPPTSLKQYIESIDQRNLTNQESSMLEALNASLVELNIYNHAYSAKRDILEAMSWILLFLGFSQLILVVLIFKRTTANKTVQETGTVLCDDQ